MWIVSAFIEVDVPQTGLTPTIKIYKISDSSIVVNGASMIEIGDGLYKYEFMGYDAAENYAFICDGGSGLIARYSYSTSTFKDHTPELNVITTDNEFIKNMIGGRWKVDATTSQMIFYEDDNVTEVARFDLYDRFGNPSIVGDEIFERERV
jgi:hypothetical protein